MVVKLRLARHGSKKKPYYRIVAANDTARRDGRFIEHLGSYDPAYSPPAVSLKRDRVRYWLGEGAQATHTVNNILKEFMEREDTAIRARPRIVTPAPAAAAAAAVAPAAPAPAAPAPAAPAPAAPAATAAAEPTAEA